MLNGSQQAQHYAAFATEPFLMSNPVLTARGKLGYQIRAKNPEGITEARRNLAAEKILAYAEKVVADAPPLTDEQCSIISTALGGEMK